MCKLSIIVPVYNVEKYIKKCLESIFDQQVDPSFFEVVVVNDGTKDNSMQIVDEFTRRYSNFFVIEQENQGLSVARNNGLAAAQGDYVWFVDSDDTLLPNALSDLSGLLESSPSVDVFSTILLTVDESSGKTVIEYAPKVIGSMTGKDYLFRGYRQGASQRFIIKKSFLEGNKLYFAPGKLHEDGEFGFRMLYLAPTVFLIDKPYYAYLLRSVGSIMSSWKVKSAYDLIDIHMQLMCFANEKVDKKDKRKFTGAVFHIIESIFKFSKRNIDTADFRSFFYDKQAYIKEESRRLISLSYIDSPRYLFKGIQYAYFPFLEIKLKRSIKKYISI